MRNVLVPVDFESESLKAIQDLDKIKSWLNDNLNIRLVHCIGPSDLKKEPYPKLRDDALHKLIEVSHQYIPAEVLDDGSITCEVLDEGVEYIHQNYFNENKIDIVVMGTSGLEDDAVLETTTTSEHITRHQGTYFIVPSDCELGNLEHLLICADYNSEDVDQYNFFIEVARSSGARISVLYVEEAGGELSLHQQHNKLELQGKFSCMNASFHEYYCNDVVAGINRFARENEVDLVCAIPRHNSFLERFYHLSIAKKLAQHSKTPLLLHS